MKMTRIWIIFSAVEYLTSLPPPSSLHIEEMKISEIEDFIFYICRTQNSNLNVIVDTNFIVR